MAVRRLVLGVSLGLAAVSAVPARAEDPAVHTQPLKTELFEDIVDGIGGVLGVLVGPPISSPSPYLNIPGALPPESPPEPPGPVTVAAPPVAVPPPVPAAPEAVPSPAAAPLPPPQPAPPPAVKAMAAPSVPPPPPRPATPPAAASAAPPPPAAVAPPACTVRVAATATLEQMRRLPKCP